MIFLYAQNIPDDHPAIEVLHDLETTAYYIDGDLPGYNLAIVQVILRWANMLNSRLKVVRPMYCGFTFLTRLPRVWLFLFPTLT